jgi:hypothetical protein
MAIQNFFTSRDNKADGSTFVGQTGRLWLNLDDNTIYVSDGTTPGGVAVGSGGDYGNANVANFLANYGTNTISTSGNVVFGNINLVGNLIGNVQSIEFDTDHDTSTHSHPDGTVCWNNVDHSLNVFTPGNVVLQIGQEEFMLSRNNTGNNIADGVVVGFAGAENNGTARIEVAPYLANGATPSLYAVGITTQDIANGEDGMVTVFGKVRDIDTTGNSVGETWGVGNILYASPTVAGGFTNVKPTAPNNVIPMAAVLKVDDSEGEIFVRPTISQMQYYGRFNLDDDLTIPVADTANVVVFANTEITNGVVLGTPASRIIVPESGLYQVDVSAQVDATGGGFSSGTMYVWLKKNGSDIAGSTRRQGVLGAAPAVNFSFTFVLSLAADDYIEIGYASNSTSVFFDSSNATAFAPSTVAIRCGVTQIQL